MSGPLWGSPKAREKGFAWCLFASLDHLLPIVDLDKEFSEFFDHGRESLTAFQRTYFRVHVLVGVLLGGAVIAGLTGLTQAD